MFSQRLCNELKEYLTQNNNTTLIQKIEEKIEVKIGKDIPPNPESSYLNLLRKKLVFNK